ncbi:MAG: glycosyl transferase [Pseudomonadota bacterium]
MQLIYFSPVPWASFQQRPHEFAGWAHRRLGARILWVEPYPVRLPMLQDLRRPASAGPGQSQLPDWLQVIAPKALPLEPLGPGRALNQMLFWPRIISSLREFAARDPRTLIVVGKPSHLALSTIEALPGARCFYDAMDDFPVFHHGAARLANAQVEQAIVRRCFACSTSSTYLAQRLRTANSDVHLIPNGLATDRMPDAIATGASSKTGTSFGYVGTLGAWFDWAWIAALASAWPERAVDIYGPMYRQPSVKLPGNVHLHPALPHAQALRKMAGFGAGLIPFLQNELTESVDPVKYYEYRGLGLGVVSTPFGEMRQRADAPRVVLTADPGKDRAQIDALLTGRDTAESVSAFRGAHAWDTRFEPLAAVLAPAS